MLNFLLFPLSLSFPTNFAEAGLGESGRTKSLFNLSQFGKGKRESKAEDLTTNQLDMCSPIFVLANLASRAQELCYLFFYLNQQALRTRKTAGWARRAT